MYLFKEHFHSVFIWPRKALHDVCILFMTNT